MDDRHERIRQRAHEIWEREGRPDGREHEHWDRATKEITAEGDQFSEIPQKPDAVSTVTGSSPSAEQVTGMEPAIEEHPTESPPKRRSAKPKSPID
jgi:hypothetical protein